MQKQVIKIFNRSKIIANKEKSVKIKDFASFEKILYEQPIMNIIDQISYINKTFHKIVYMGSQPELFLSNLPSNISLQTFILWDISQVSLEASLAKIEELGSLPGDCDILPLVNDEELFCLAPDSVDLIISNNNLHLVNDPSLALQRMQHALQPDGVLVGSLFGEETLQELRISFTLAEGERSGGVSQHVSPFQNIQDMGNTIVRCDYRVPTVYTASRMLVFDSVFHLMQFLQQTGQANPLQMVRSGINRPLIQAMAALYQTLFTSRIYLQSQGEAIHLEGKQGEQEEEEQGEGEGEGEGEEHDERVIATFENIYFSGWKYDPKVKFQRQSQVKSETIDDFDTFVQEIKENSTEDARIRMGSIDENNVITEKKIQ